MNQKNNTLIPSPCVNICALDDKDICIGCSRHGKEISQWGNYSNSQKQLVLQRCRERNQGNYLPFSMPE